MPSCSDILGCIWPLSTTNQADKYKEVGAFKKNDDLVRPVEETAIVKLSKLCEKRELQSCDFQEIAKKYVKVYRFQKNELEIADSFLKGVIRDSEGFVKKFNISVVDEMKKVLSPKQVEELCTHVAAKIR